MFVTLPRTKMNTAFICSAAAFALAFANSTSAQQPVAQVSAETSTPSNRSWATSRKFSLDDLSLFGDTYVSNKWDDNASVIPTLGLGGDHALLYQIVPTLAIDYHERLDLRAITDRPTSPGKIFVVLKKGSVKRELSPSDLTELELADESLLSRGAVAKWRIGEPTIESIQVWLSKFAGLKTTLPQLPELTSEELSKSLTTDKPYEFVFYRSQDSLNQDATLTPERRTLVWKTQSAALAETARRAARLRPLLTVRKLSTTKQLNGTCLYDLVAAGSWEGYPVGVIVRGSLNRNERERWGPFCKAPQEGRSYAEELEIKALLCLGLEPLLSQMDKGAITLSATSSIPPNGEKKVVSSK